MLDRRSLYRMPSEVYFALGVTVIVKVDPGFSMN
jgi:hypothetical protein